MIVVNTTFHIPATLKPVLVEWLRGPYTESAVQAGHINPRIARVMGGNAEDRDGISIAFQTEAQDLRHGRAWHDGKGQELRIELLKAAGKDKVAFFTTYLQVL